MDASNRVKIIVLMRGIVLASILAISLLSTGCEGTESADMNTGDISGTYYTIVPSKDSSKDADESNVKKEILPGVFANSVSTTVIEYQYDDEGRVLKKTEIDDYGEVNVEEHKYDGNGNEIPPENTGMIYEDDTRDEVDEKQKLIQNQYCGRDDGVFTKVFEYKGVRATTGSVWDGKRLSFTYDLSGNLINYEYGDDYDNFKSVQYDYDAQKRLIEIKETAKSEDLGTLRTNIEISYNAQGDIIEEEEFFRENEGYTQTTVKKYEFNKKGRIRRCYIVEESWWGSENEKNVSKVLTIEYSYKYYDDGTIKEEKAVDSEGFYSVIKYDKRENILFEAMVEDDNTIMSATEYEYDDHNNVVVERAWFSEPL